jgi:hypothetical protein
MATIPRGCGTIVLLSGGPAHRRPERPAFAEILKHALERTSIGRDRDGRAALPCNRQLNINTEDLMPRVRKTTESTRTRRSVKKIDPSAELFVPAEEIAAEAYAQYLARNGQQGDALSDWLIAEQIVKRRYIASQV